MDLSLTEEQKVRKQEFYDTCKELEKRKPPSLVSMKAIFEIDECWEYNLYCTKEASMAKAYVNEVYKDLSKWAVRLHGAIATSADHDIPLYYRRSKAADTAFGSTDFHREIVAQKIGLV